MIRYLIQLLAPDFDTIVHAFNKVDAKLEKLIQREHQRRVVNATMIQSLKEDIERIEGANRDSVQTVDRAGRVRSRIKELTA